jgi:hypothetical protein
MQWFFFISVDPVSTPKRRCGRSCESALWAPDPYGLKKLEFNNPDNAPPIPLTGGICPPGVK